MIITCTGCQADLFLRHWTSEAVSGRCPVCHGPFQTAGTPRKMGSEEVWALTGRGGLPARSGRGRDSTAVRNNPLLSLVA